MEKIEIYGEFLFELYSKTDWINKCPDRLPPKRTHAEEWIWIDKNGFSLVIGQDFEAAKTMCTYPVKVYRKIRVYEASQIKQEKLYYIRTQGYSGNSLIWWRPNSQGYTSDIKQAGKYTEEETKQICSGSKTELGYECEKVHNLGKGLFHTVHADYLLRDTADIDYREK